MPVEDIVFEESNDFIMQIPDTILGGEYLTVSYDGVSIKTDAQTSTIENVDYAFIS